MVVAAIITACGAGFSALVGTLGVFFTLRVRNNVEQVHQVVNSRLTALLERQERLIGALKDEGIKVPQPLDADTDTPIGETPNA